MPEENVRACQFFVRIWKENDVQYPPENAVYTERRYTKKSVKIHNTAIQHNKNAAHIDKDLQKQQ